MIPKASVWVNAGLFALLAWWFGGDLYDGVRAQSAEVAALSGMPSLPFAGGMVLLAVVCGALTVLGVLQKRDGSWKSYRLMPIVAVVGLFVDLFIVSADKAPFSPAWRASAAVELFQNRASELASETQVSIDKPALEAALTELGDSPWLIKAKPAGKWQLVVETGCAGPKLEVKGAAAGTMFYCAAADRQQAWITVVGLPREEHFGPAQLFTAGGTPVVGVVQRRPPEGSPGAGQKTSPIEMLPMYFDADAGNLPPPP